MSPFDDLEPRHILTKKITFNTTDASWHLSGKVYRSNSYNNPYFDRRIVVRGEKPLATVTVSPKYQVVIPSDVRERLKLKPGQKVAVIEKDGVVHLVPIRPLKELKGMASGATLKGLRDEGDRR